MFKELLPALPRDQGTCIERASPDALDGTLHKMAASFAIEAVVSAPGAGQVGDIACKTIARHLISWMFQPT